MRRDIARFLVVFWPYLSWVRVGTIVFAWFVLFHWGIVVVLLFVTTSVVLLL